jgi:hypothetical protein
MVAKHVRRQQPPAPSPASPRAFGSALDVLLALGAAALVVVVFHRAMGYFFRADDFEGLARARGLMPARAGLARLIPWRLYFPLIDRTFGLDPVPYHVASLAALAAAAALLFAWLRRPAGRWPALIGAAWYAAHPAHYAAAYWISAIGDPLAAAFSLAALLAARSARRVRWSALPLLALALVSKESAFLVPAVAFADPGRDPALPAARRDPLPWTLAAMSATILGYYLAFDPLGARHPGGAAYVPRFGAQLAPHLLTYAAWSVNFLAFTLRSISDAVEPGGFPVAVGLLLAMLAAAAWPDTRRRGALAGGLLWAAMLAPVVPLAQIYRYYLCGPLAGLAIVFAAVLSSALARLVAAPGKTRAAGLAAGAALAASLLLAWNGAATVSDIEFAPFTLPGSRADAIVDRALIARRAADDLAQNPPPAGVDLRFWSPTARAMAGYGDSTEALGYWEMNVSASLLGGIGARVLQPQIRSAEFVPRFTPAGDSVWYAVYRANGTLRAGPAPNLERAIRSLGGAP